MARIREGYARVISPFGGRELRVSLAPEDVIAIVFWTKNAAPLLAELDELTRRGHCFTFLYTINNYPRWLEPEVPDEGHTLRIVKTMAERFSPHILRWRYDTIVLTDRLDHRWHINNFRRLCRMLAPHTSECIFSFCDYYRKTIRNMDLLVTDYRQPNQEECKELAEEMADAAQECGITLASCAHDFLVSDRIVKAHCVDPIFLRSVVDTEARVKALDNLKAAPTRPDCGCAASKDIGAYDTCAHGCVYCYANSDAVRARRNLEQISPADDCLHPRARCLQSEKQ
jgi:hypothetical protein